MMQINKMKEIKERGKSKKRGGRGEGEAKGESLSLLASVINFCSNVNLWRKIYNCDGIATRLRRGFVISRAGRFFCGHATFSDAAVIPSSATRLISVSQKNFRGIFHIPS